MTENIPIRWVVGLSSGDTLVEDRGIVTSDAMESSWDKLQKHLQLNNLTITSMGLWVGDKHFDLPSNDPKSGGIAPISYNCFRYHEDVMGFEEDIVDYIHADAIYENFTIQLWVNMADTNKCWVNFVTKEDEAKLMERKVKIKPILATEV